MVAPIVPFVVGILGNLAQRKEDRKAKRDIKRTKKEAERKKKDKEKLAKYRKKNPVRGKEAIKLVTGNNKSLV